MGGAYNISLAKVHGSVIFAPAGRLVPEALRALERGGTVALAGVVMMPLPELGNGGRLYWDGGHAAWRISPGRTRRSCGRQRPDRSSNHCADFPDGGSQRGAPGAQVERD